jgi:predicted membrane protein
MDKYKSSKRYGFGVVVLLTGLVLLLGNLGLLPAPLARVLLHWPMILIAIAVISLINREWVGGFILMGIGLYFLLPDFIPRFSFYQIWRFWPVFLIIGGIAILRGKQRHRKFQADSHINYHSNNEDVIEEMTVFGGNISLIQSKNFRGGEITSIFGGSEVNFTEASLAPEGAVIEMTAVFGGVKIIVPREWHVKHEVVSILGGFTDKRVPGGDRTDRSRTLVIKGTTIFGGGELLSY